MNQQADINPGGVQVGDGLCLVFRGNGFDCFQLDKHHLFNKKIGKKSPTHFPRNITLRECGARVETLAVRVRSTWPVPKRTQEIPHQVRGLPQKHNQQPSGRSAQVS